MKVNEVSPGSIKAERLQTRAATSSDYIDDLAERMLADDIFPPIVIFTDGEESWLADGIHRLDAAVKAKKKIGVDQRKGTRADAIEFACGANAAHGLRRSNADRRRTVNLALEAFPDRSSRAIAQLCGVSNHLVEEIRAGNSPTSTKRSGGNSPTSSGQAAPRRTGRDGKQYPAMTKRQQARAAALAAQQSELEQNGQPEFDPDSLEGVQADLREFATACRALAQKGRKILRCEGNEVTRPFCGCYTVVTLIHPLHEVARNVANDLPVGGTPKKPVLFHEQQAKA